MTDVTERYQYLLKPTYIFDDNIINILGIRLDHWQICAYCFDSMFLFLIILISDTARSSSYPSSLIFTISAENLANLESNNSIKSTHSLLITQRFSQLFLWFLVSLSIRTVQNYIFSKNYSLSITLNSLNTFSDFWQVSVYTRFNFSWSQPFIFNAFCGHS